MKKIKYLSLLAVVFCMTFVFVGCGGAIRLTEEWDVAERVIPLGQFTEQTVGDVKVYIPDNWVPHNQQGADKIFFLEKETGNSSIVFTSSNKKTNLKKAKAEEHAQIFASMDKYEETELITHGLIDFCGDTMLYVHATGVYKQTDAIYDFYQFAVSKNKKTYYITLFVNTDVDDSIVEYADEDVDIAEKIFLSLQFN